ncbi:MAG: membrane protease subunit HflC [Chloroflexi bacterium]|jgi:membrane protease subunit HflC|nr:MAG: membrane protease subunit HflC [Chloroflexota bacterium]
MRTLVIAGIVILLLGIVGPQAFYTVDETQFALVTRFGEIKQVNTSPGLRGKTPFVDSVTYLDRRLLRVDMPPSTLPDQDQQFLTIDAYTRYRTIDPKKFFEKLGSKTNAADRVGRIVSSLLREEVGKINRTEIIGGIVDEETGVVTPMNTRIELLERVRAASDLAVKSTLNDFGIEIVDVRMKRADFPDAVAQNIFTRMRSERDKLAKGFRSEGDKTKLEIESDVDRLRAIILAEANKQSNIIRGEGEARAIEIFASALEQDPEFFAFQRSLEAYKKFLESDATLVLSSESELFKYLENPAGLGSSPGE